MWANLLRYIERFHFTKEGQEVFLSSVKNLAKEASGTPGHFIFNPAYFWDESDLKNMDQASQNKLLNWLYDEALMASKTATEDYDYSIAPPTVEELEEEVQMIQLAGAIFRVLQLRDRSHLSVVLADAQGHLLKRFPDGRVEYIKLAKISGK